MSNKQNQPKSTVIKNSDQTLASKIPPAPVPDPNVKKLVDN